MTVKSFTVYIELQPEGRYYEVPYSELQNDAWGRAMSTTITKSDPWIRLSLHHTSIFGYYMLWLHHRPLHPYVDLSRPLNPTPYVTNTNTPANSMGFTIEEEVNTPNCDPVNLVTTISALSNRVLDHAPNLQPPARRLLHAYFLGLSLGVSHFQDAVTNSICLSFAPDVPPLPAFVREVYERSGPEIVGLKKFCIDYYIFCHLLSSHNAVKASRTEDSSAAIDDTTTHNAVQDQLQVSPLKDYQPAFLRDVTKTMSDLRTELPAKVKIGPYERVRKEYKDVQVDFGNLEDWLRDADEGRQKCRYQQHGKDELCFNRITWRP